MKRLVCLGALLCVAFAAFADDLPPNLPDGLYATFTTSEGVFVARLFEKYTPIAVANFVGLAMGTRAWLDPTTHMPVKRPMYNGINFHRILRGKMIQSGDPTGTSQHNCGFTIRDETLLGLNFDRGGKLAVANSGAPDSGACQWFVTVDAVPEWNQKYTIFGEIISGLPVVETINKGKLIGDKPVDPVKLIKVMVVRIGAPPAAKAVKKKK
jgi:peptidyl-prolyl cis-trans isomerase A (cyclophilin A)